MISRLFDIVEQKSNVTPQAEMLAAKEGGVWKTYSCGQVWENANKLAGALLALGIANTVLEPEHQEKIAIISPNRPEWMITDIAVQLTGAVLTPIYPTISPNELSFIIKEAGIRMVFVANEEIYYKYKDTFRDSKTVSHIFSFNLISGVTNWKDLIAQNLLPDKTITESIKTETLATIIYTSGTTGEPKGVMLSHSNIVSNVLDCMPIFSFANAGGRALSFLPLNHIFERMVTYVYLHSGVAVYYAENMDTIGVNLKEVKPITFTTVPRLLEKVYERITAAGMEHTGIKKKVFLWAMALGNRFDNIKKGSLWYRFQLYIANLLVFSKWREALGGNTKAIVVGSAACQERLERLYTAGNIVIMEGYGLTETSPVVCVNRFESKDRRIGTIGPLINNVEAKIAEDGELLVKGKNVMMGYYNRQELTNSVMTDGWFHTGDIAEWVEGRFLKITDRKKEIFKTSGGKYVSPQALENKMKESPYIEQMMVIGNGRKFVSALIVPNFNHVRKYLTEKNPNTSLPESNSELVLMSQVTQLIQKEVDGFNPLFSHPEQIKKIHLLVNEWTVDNGELTPSLKMKRKNIEQKYISEIEEIYQ